MTKATRWAVPWAVCGSVLVVASAGCTARDRAPEARRIESVDQVENADTGAAEPVAATPTVPTPAAPTPAPRPIASSPKNETVAKPNAPPPAKPTPAPPRQVVKPSPWQPPAVIDPVPPEVGNETPG
jgi:hypothetical protein